MNVLITGSSTGIGKVIAEKFLSEGYFVYGLDRQKASIKHDNYKHYNCDLINLETYPSFLPEMHYVINNAGTDDQKEALKTNLLSLFEIEDRWINENTKCVINIASTSAHFGIENREYVASKGRSIILYKTIS